jgi:hypothetical protein
MGSKFRSGETIEARNFFGATVAFHFEISPFNKQPTSSSLPFSKHSNATLTSLHNKLLLLTVKEERKSLQEFRNLRMMNILLEHKVFAGEAGMSIGVVSAIIVGMLVTLLLIWNQKVKLNFSSSVVELKTILQRNEQIKGQPPHIPSAIPYIGASADFFTKPNDFITKYYQKVRISTSC